MSITLPEWTAALRSGTYQQCKGFLRTDRGNCCWGVAHDVDGTGDWCSVNEEGRMNAEYHYIVDEDNPDTAAWYDTSPAEWLVDEVFKNHPERQIYEKILIWFNDGNLRLQLREAERDVYDRYVVRADDEHTFPEIADIIDQMGADLGIV